MDFIGNHSKAIMRINQLNNRHRPIKRTKFRRFLPNAHVTARRQNARNLDDWQDWRFTGMVGNKRIDTKAQQYP